MSNPPDFSEYSLLPSAPNPKERKAGAEATTSEAEAPYAGRKAAASVELTEAQARRAAAAAATEEAKAATAAQKAAEAEAGQGRQKAERMETLGGYLGQLQRARDAISSGVAMGPAGQITGGVWGTPAADLKGILESISNPIVLEAMAEARKGSAQGATGFGALSQKELELLKGKFGSLRQSQDPETLLKTLDEIDASYRRLMAYNAGYDPYTAEGAKMVGLPLPEDAAPEQPAVEEPMKVGADVGEWVEDPELRGLDASIGAMIKAGRSADQIRQWLDEYQPGLGGRVEGLEDQIRQFKKTGEIQVNPNFGKYYKPAEPTILGKIADSDAGAFAIATADQLGSGFLTELAAGEMSGPEYEKRATIMRGLRDKYEGASTAGDIFGGVLSTAGGAMSLGRAGAKLPWLLEGVGQEALYGYGSSEPGQRGEGAFSNALMAPATNIFGKVGSDAIGGVLRGADPEKAILAEKYGINLTPGQLTGREATERNLAGMPLLGPQISARRNETLEQFNAAAFEEALAPIGARTTAIGQRGIAEAQQATGQAYRDALDGVTLDISDPAFMPAIRGQSYAKLGQLRDIGPELQAEVDDIFAKYVDPQSGTLTGEGMQNALQELQQLKQAYKGDARWAKRIAPALDDISDGYAGLLERQAPENFQMFQRANEAYRNVSVLEQAVTRAPEGDIFGPRVLDAAATQGTVRFGGKKAAARGDKPFNELTMSAFGTIPNKADDVSLAGRIAAPVAGAGSFGAITGASMLASPENDRADDGDGFLPPWVLAAAAGAALGSMPYSRTGVRLSGKPLLGPRTDRQRMLGDMLQNYGAAAVRGVMRDGTQDAPMPQEFDYSKVGSPDFRKIVEMAAGNAQPLTPEEQSALVGDGQFVDVDAAGNTIEPQSGMMIGGRPVERDPVTGEMVFSDTSEPVPGFAEGGQVSFQQRQRAQQERIAGQSRTQALQIAQARDARVAPGRERAAANGNRRTAPTRAPKTSHMTDIAMAASRRGNDLAAMIADLSDRYIKPADAVAWIAQNIEGRSPEEVARIRQNLQPIDSMRSVVDAGAIENERRFAAAGGLGARTGDDVVAPVRMSAAAYRPEDIMPALASEAPRAFNAVRDYFTNNSMGAIAGDAMSAGRAGYESFRRDPYGSIFENALYATPATALMASPFDYAGMRESSQMLAPYAGDDAEAAKAQRMVDALSVLPGLAAVPGMAPAGRRAMAVRPRGR
jgi:hypothetical protein